MPPLPVRRRWSTSPATAATSSAAASPRDPGSTPATACCWWAIAATAAATGGPTEEGLYADGRAAIAYLRGRGVPARRIALYGESLGTGVAVKMAVEHEVGAVILEAPFTSAVDVGARAYPILPVRWLMKDRYESLGPHRRHRRAAADRPRRGRPDDSGRPTDAGMLAAAREPKQGVFIAGAGHDDLRAYGADAAMLRFLEATFPPE